MQIVSTLGPATPNTIKSMFVANQKGTQKHPPVIHHKLNGDWHTERHALKWCELI